MTPQIGQITYRVIDRKLDFSNLFIQLNQKILHGPFLGHTRCDQVHHTNLLLLHCMHFSEMLLLNNKILKNHKRICEQLEALETSF